MRRPEDARRSPWRGRSVLVCLAAFSFLSACNDQTPQADDPLRGASTVTGVALPDNIGPSNCEPVSSTDRTSHGTEFHGSATPGDSLWAYVSARTPIHVGRPVKILWRVTGVVRLRLVAVGPSDVQVEPTTLFLAPGIGWSKPGDPWSSVFTFPAAGCWRISVERGTMHGDVWFRAA